MLLGGRPHLTRHQVAEQSGVPLEVATRLWELLGFVHPADDEEAFTDADVVAVQHAQRLVDLGVLGADRQAALVRTWGRSYARLAEWQSALLADVVLESGAAPAEALPLLAEEVLPVIDELQSYVWRRHLVSAGGRRLATGDPSAPSLPSAVCFVDIVGYTSRSRTLDDAALVAWIETFEARTAELVTAAGGRVIKNIGDEVLFVADDVRTCVDVALAMVALGDDEDDPFPAVRAGIAYGEVVHRLGDVFGPTVNIAARLTSAARPSTVLVDRGAHDALAGVDTSQERDADDGAGGPGGPDADDAGHHDHPHPEGLRLRRVRRVSAKGYSRLAAWVVRPRD
ncbi:MAG: adenylate/guanylate cyclase domain-containing protein [Nocardioides sp.]|nr:adenylate/guanylate cyclase domain-containing protein [Nocardioides sp.]